MQDKAKVPTKGCEFTSRNDVMKLIRVPIGTAVGTEVNILSSSGEVYGPYRVSFVHPADENVALQAYAMAYKVGENPNKGKPLTKKELEQKVAQLLAEREKANAEKASE